ncbi:sulfotransferase domain-containing protein [Hyphobacterium sp.]|uniref:sulfotransferase domain-containing protein n=1 Tax=Hyphobacterium sp. TaxID=2004662 RepID=UPI0037489C46
MAYHEILTKLPEGDPTFQPCFVFSVHKCGSTMLHSMIEQVAKVAALPATSIPNELFHYGIFEPEWERDPNILPYFQKRMLYYGFRTLPPVLTDPSIALRHRRFVLLVRDPRDALVSQYFSFGTKSGSHRLPSKYPEAFKKILSATDELPIDEYVLTAASNLREKLQAYRDALNFDLGLLWRYEDAYFDKRGLLEDTFAHLGVEVDPSILNSVAQLADIRPEMEDPTKHIRKGTPGDHQEKLRPETIAELNEVFRDVGRFYGYVL